LNYDPLKLNVQRRYDHRHEQWLISLKIFYQPLKFSSVKKINFHAFLNSYWIKLSKNKNLEVAKEVLGARHKLKSTCLANTRP
jgi:hypothetical protein